MIHTDISRCANFISAVALVLLFSSCGPSEELVAANAEVAEARERASESGVQLETLRFTLEAAEERKAARALLMTPNSTANETYIMDLGWKKLQPNTT